MEIRLKDGLRFIVPPWSSFDLLILIIMSAMGALCPHCSQGKKECCVPFLREIGFSFWFLIAGGSRPGEINGPAC